MSGRRLVTSCLLAVALFAVAGQAAAQPCLIFVHGKQTNTNTYTSYSSARNYWVNGSADFIRTAIRRQLDGRATAVDDTVARRALTLGTRHLGRAELERLRAAGEQIEVRVLGLATVADDVSPELALATISAVEVLGAFRASPAVKAALAPRTV